MPIPVGIMMDLLGAVNLSIYRLLVMHCSKQVEPVFDMVKVAPCLPTRKNRHQSTPPCPWCTAWSVQSSFSHARNECDGSVLRICMLADTMCHHPWKQDVFHESQLGQTEIFLQWACSFPWICAVRESAYFLNRWLPISRQVPNLFWQGSHLQHVWIISFPWHHFSSRFVFLNPLPDSNMASLDDVQERQCPNNASQWQAKKVQVQTMTNVFWGGSVSLVAHTGNKAFASYRISVKLTEPI